MTQKRKQFTYLQTDRQKDIESGRHADHLYYIVVYIGPQTSLLRVTNFATNSLYPAPRIIKLIRSISSPIYFNKAEIFNSGFQTSFIDAIQAITQLFISQDRRAEKFASSTFDHLTFFYIQERQVWKPFAAEAPTFLGGQTSKG